MRHILLAALLLPGLARADAAQEAVRLTEALVRAVAAGHPEQALAMCAEPMLSREALSCEDLVRELQAGTLQLVPAGSAGSGRLGVAVFWGVTPGDEIPVWLAVRKLSRGWRIVDGGDSEGPAPNLGFPLPEAAMRLPAGLTAPPEHVVTLLDAMNSGQLDRLIPLCSPALAEDPYGCPQIAAAVAERQATLRALALRAAGPRQVLRVHLLVGRTPRDEVLAYLEEQDGRWLLVGLDESEAHARDYLAGALPAALGPDSLVDDEQAAALARTLSEVAAGRRSADEAGFAAGHGPDPAHGWLRPPLEMVWARRLRDTDRYALCLTIDGDALWTTWRRAEDGWWFLQRGFSMAECPLTLSALAVE